MLKKAHKEYIDRPDQTEFVHASTNLYLKDGSIVLAWFSGSREGNDDVSIYYAKRNDGEWSNPEKLNDNIAEPHWNPVLFPLNEESLVLYYKVGRKITEWRTYSCVSRDGGVSFLNPEELVKGDFGGRGPVRNKPIRLSNGDIAAPASSENGIWHAFVDLSSDDGRSWTASSDVTVEDLVFDKKDIVITESLKKIPVSEQSYFGRGVIQPTLWESLPGHVHMLLRSTEGCIFRSDSSDYGRTWTRAYKTGLPNNNSGIDLVKVDNGNLFLVFNPVGENWGNRSPLSLSFSSDNGTTWEKVMDLDCGEGEFSYPAITATDNKLYISYSFKRENIVFWEIELNS